MSVLQNDMQRRTCAYHSGHITIFHRDTLPKNYSYIMPVSVRFCHTAVFSCSTLRLTCVPSKKDNLLPCFTNIPSFDGAVISSQLNPVSVPRRLQVILNSDVLGGACNGGEVTSEYVASRWSVPLWQPVVPKGNRKTPTTSSRLDSAVI